MPIDILPVTDVIRFNIQFLGYYNKLLQDPTDYLASSN